MKGGTQRNCFFSPERIIGLADCLGGNSRIRSFGLREALYHSYVNDLRFVLFVCLILGFSWWSQYWPNIPGEWFVQQPEIVVNPQLVHTYEEALSCFKSDSSNMALEAQCPHAGCVHDRVSQFLDRSRANRSTGTKTESRDESFGYGDQSNCNCNGSR